MKSPQHYEECNSITGLTGGVLCLDVAKKGNMMAYGTQDGEVTLVNAEAFTKESDSDDESSSPLK
jgi:hypothetical protein